MLITCFTRQISRFPSLQIIKYCTSSKTKVSRVKLQETETSSPKIDRNKIELLEKLSLVDFGDERGIKIVEDAIKFADKLQEVDTTGVEPLITVLENESLYLREDKVESEISRIDLLSHSKTTLEDHYVAPVGNIAFKPQQKHAEISNVNLKKEVNDSEKLKQIN